MGQIRGAQTWLDVIDSDLATGVLSAQGCEPGENVTVALVDSGIQAHPDLREALVRGKELSDAYSQLAAAAGIPPKVNWPLGTVMAFTQTSNTGQKISVNTPHYPHGTACAGIIAAAGKLYVNGVAPGCSLVDCNRGEDNASRTYVELGFRADVIDIYSCSFGIPTFPGPDDCPLCGQVYTTTGMFQQGTGRGGLGNIYVVSAGNAYLTGGQATWSPLLNIPPTIIVGARNLTSSVHSSYSAAGANILVSAVGGKDTIYTSGNTLSNWHISAGSETGVVTTGPYPEQPVNMAMNGTSAATPMISGVVSLMLCLAKRVIDPSTRQPLHLTWRDVKNILARSARPSLLGGMVDTSSDPLRVRLDDTFEHATSLRYQDSLGAVPQADGRLLYHNSLTGFGTVSAYSALREIGGFVDPYTGEALPPYRPMVTANPSSPLARMFRIVPTREAFPVRIAPFTRVDAVCSPPCDGQANPSLSNYYCEPPVALGGSGTHTIGELELPVLSNNAVLEEVVLTFNVPWMFVSAATLGSVGVCLVRAYDGKYASSWLMGCQNWRNTSTGVPSTSLYVSPSTGALAEGVFILKTEGFRGVQIGVHDRWFLVAGAYSETDLAIVSLPLCHVDFFCANTGH